MKRMNKKQKGFTIIELVVVILLLGILTATALPRFMDVENQAHGAVVNAVQAGLVTSAGLFRAQWYAEGQPETVVDYDLMRASSDGYALGLNNANTVTSMEDSDDCVDIFTNFLQDAGRPSIDVIEEEDSVLDAGMVDNAASTTDFLAYVDTSTGFGLQCSFIYTGQFTDATNEDVPVLTYDAEDGTVELTTM